MSELGDDFREWREYKRKRKAEFVATATRVLGKEGVFYTVLDYGTNHFRIENRVDYWPGTGTWIVLETRERGYGLRELIKYIKEN